MVPTGPGVVPPLSLRPLHDAIDGRLVPGIDHTAAVRLRPRHVQAELPREVIIRDRLIPVRHCVYRGGDVAAMDYQYHGMTFPTERPAGNATKFPCIRGSGGLHIHMVGAALPL